AFYLSRAVLPAMIRKKAGRIIQISSMWGISGGSCEVAYSAAKAALIGFTKSLAKEVGPSGITVNCVAPGVIDTPMNAHLSDDDLKALADETPLCRIGTPAEVANAVAFFAGDQSTFITGQVLAVDGGITV
ncbi:MAG: SDR family oxidoreductase, partial [Clostridia bacterium]|nr:SDR family oxidoreductase [Clostridia bacterium]